MMGFKKVHPLKILLIPKIPSLVKLITAGSEVRILISLDFKRKKALCSAFVSSGAKDSNLGPSGYEPDELPLLHPASFIAPVDRAADIVTPYLPSVKALSAGKQDQPFLPIAGLHLGRRRRGRWHRRNLVGRHRDHRDIPGTVHVPVLVSPLHHCRVRGGVSYLFLQAVLGVHQAGHLGAHASFSVASAGAGRPCGG